MIEALIAEIACAKADADFMEKLRALHRTGPGDPRPPG